MMKTTECKISIINSITSNGKRIFIFFITGLLLLGMATEMSLAMSKPEKDNPNETEFVIEQIIPVIINRLQEEAQKNSSSRQNSEFTETPVLIINERFCNLFSSIITDIFTNLHFECVQQGESRTFSIQLSAGSGNEIVTRQNSKASGNNVTGQSFSYNIKPVSENTSDRIRTLFDRYVDEHYTGHENETLVRISGAMINSIKNDITDTVWNDIFQRLSSINIYMNAPQYISNKHPKVFDQFSDLKDQYNKSYEEILSVVRGGSKQGIYVLRSQNNQIKELLLVYQNREAGGIISVRGDLNDDDLETFRKGVNLDKMPGIHGW